MSLVRKSRELPFGGARKSRTYTQYYSSTGLYAPANKNWSDHITKDYMGYQITDSENHAWPPPKGSSGDVGGAFGTEKRYGSLKRSALHYSFTENVNPGQNSGYDRLRFEGNMSLSAPFRVGPQGSPSFPPILKSTSSAIESAGATAISRVKPTSSAAELSTALGEIVKEGLPHLVGSTTWRERTLHARNAGGEYLNVVFGWSPLISEVSNFGTSVIKSDSILKQYDSDRGKIIRRTYSFPVEESSSSEVLSTTAWPLGSDFREANSRVGRITKPGTWSLTTTSYKKRWFSGAFVYGAPVGMTSRSGIAGLAAKADRLFGLSLTPDVLWNLAPWSWAIDWFTNTGDVLSTVGDMMSQGLVMQYGYMMEHTVHTYRYSLVGAEIYGVPASVGDTVLVTETKSRHRANPFGFGISWEGLSSSQAAILAALGISRT
jgi:hypothetical protein